MTRDSVRQAFRGGITADQIISYLEQHAHPNVSSKIRSLAGDCIEKIIISILLISDVDERLVY